MLCLLGYCVSLSVSEFAEAETCAEFRAGAELVPARPDSNPAQETSTIFMVNVFSIEIIELE